MQEFNVIQTIAIYIIPVLFAITVHEVAHGWVASKFGDQTARLAGRLTLNPMKHIDLVGTVIVPILMIISGGFIFGWAKPMPIDVRNMRNPKTDMAIVALAGPLSNLLMALFWGCIAKFGFFLLPQESWFSVPLIYMGQAGMLFNIILAILNFLPIPPLDGARLLYNILPGKMALFIYRLEPFGFFILILLMVTGILGWLIKPPMLFMYNSLVNLLGLM